MCQWYSKHLYKISALFVALVSLNAYLVISGTTTYYSASASTSYSVCASGCDFTSLSQGFASPTVVAGDILSVQSGYSTAADAFPLTIPRGYIVDCQSSAAVIGTTTNAIVVVTTTNAIVRNCNLSNIQFNVGSATSTEFSGNTFSTSSASKIIVNSGSNISVVNNNYLSSLQIVSVASGTVSGNIFHNVSSLSNASDFGYFYNSSNLTINQNTFTTFNTSSGSTFILFSLVSSTSFTNNTVNRGLNEAYVPTQYVSFLDPVNITVSYNYFVLANYTSTTRQYVLHINPSTMHGSAIVTHNTFITRDASTVRVYDNGYDLTLDMRYNNFYGVDQTSDAIQFSKQGAGTTYSVTLGYNNFYQGNTSINNQTAHTAYAVGATDKAIRPIFKNADSTTTNDAQLVQYSALLDVNGTEDIGADNVARDSTIAVDDTGTVDYSSVDATSTSDVSPNLRTGDTVNFAAGVYDGMTVSSTSDLTGTLTMRGVASSTYFNAPTSGNSLLLKGVSSNAISNIIFQNASSTASAYALSALLYTFGDVSYDDSAAIGKQANSAVLIINSACDSTAVTDGLDVTTLVGAATSNWHIALLSAGANKLTVIVPNNFASSEVALEEICGGDIAVDLWIPNVFTVSGGDFTYNADAVALAGATLNSGFMNPPTITRTRTNVAGIKFVNASNNTITNVTSTNNGSGIWFSGTSNNNVFAESAIQNSVSYDVYSDGSGSANRLKNVSFTVASSSVSGSGAVRVLTKMRALVTDQSGTAIPGAVVSAAAQTSSEDDTTTASLSTDANGYSPFSSYLLAFVMSSASVSETAGGYNPYTFTVASTSSLPALTTTQSLNTRNQIVSLSMTPAAAETPVVQYRRYPNTTQTTQTSPQASPIVAAPTEAAVVKPVETTTDSATVEPSPVQESTKAPAQNAPTTAPSAPSAGQPQGGVPSAATEKAPSDSAATQPTKTAPVFTFKRFLSVGSVGVEVRYLQAVLKNLGFFEYPSITGNFGQLTKKAVAAYQAARNIDSVGWVGPATRAQLNAEILKDKNLINGAMPNK